MITRSCFAVLLLTTALVSAPCLSANAFAHEHEGGKGQPAGEHRHEHFTEEQKKLLHDTMHRLHEEDRKALAEIDRLHESLRHVLAAETFDRQEFLSISSEISSKHAELAKAHVDAFASIADRFTPEQREHLARLFGHHHHHHHHGMHHAGWRHGEGREGWHRHEGHDGWFHHGGYDEGVNGGTSPTTIGQPGGNDGYPPYAPR